LKHTRAKNIVTFSGNAALAALIEAMHPLLLQTPRCDALDNAACAVAEGRVDEALKVYESSLALRPNNPVALFAIGVIDISRGSMDSGLQRIEAALRECPQSLDCLKAYGQMLAAFGDHRRAIKVLYKALSVQEDAEVQLAIAASLHALSRLQEAKAHCDRVLELDHTISEAWVLKGRIFTDLGSLSEARSAFQCAIVTNDREIGAYLGLADVSTPELTPEAEGRMRALAAEATLSDGERAVVLFALGATLERLGRVRDAVGCYLTSNGLVRPHILYDEASGQEYIERIKRTFTREALCRHSGEGSQLPVFIVGMPRSGSTLIEQTLASHPSCVGLGEIDDWNAILYKNGVSDPESAVASSDATLERVGREYVDLLRRRSHSASRIVNKMLGNYLTIGQICLCLPNAKVIHISRDPVDTCMSCFSKSMPVPFAYDLTELGRHYKGYAALMLHWREVLPLNALLDVRYEEVIRDNEAQVRRILDYCGLEWDVRCLRFHETLRPVFTASAVQVRQPLDFNRVHRWRDCDDLIQPLKVALGI
jgi:Flp pilus assembly protein TadD